MTTDDISRIHDKLDRLEEMLQTLTKEAIRDKGKLESHLETSDERIRHWEKQFEFIHVEIKDCKEYIRDQQSKMKTLESLATAIKWILGALVMVITIYTFLKK